MHRVGGAPTCTCCKLVILKIPNVECLHALAAALRTKFPRSVVNAFTSDLTLTIDGVPVTSWRDTLCPT
jgi:hypothetical protein